MTRKVLEMTEGTRRIQRPPLPRLHLPVVLTICVGVALSVVAFAVIRHWEEHDVEQRFERKVGEVATALQVGITGHLEVLQYLKEFYRGSREVERQEFEEFVRDALQRRHGYQALAWIPRVPASMRRTFEETVWAAGFPSFHIHPLTERAEHFPADFVIPYAGNEQVHGFDLASSPARLEAMERARDSAEMMATAPLRPVVDTVEQPVLLVFQPIYRNGMPCETVEQRREHLTGFVAAVFRLGDLIDTTLKGLDLQGLDIHLADEEAPGPERIFYVACEWCRGVEMPCGQDSEIPNELRFATTLAVGARSWSLECHPTRGFLGVGTPWPSYGLLAGGLLLTFVVSSYLRTLIGQADRVNRLVRQRTAELSEAAEDLQQQIRDRQRAEMVISRNLEHQVRVNRLLQDDLPAAPSLGEKLRTITDTIVEVFEADFCRIWVTAPGDRCDSGCVHAKVTEGPHVCRQRERCLHLLASSGRYTHLDGEVHRRVPFGCYKIGRVAAAEDPKFLTNDIPHDPRVHNHEWARELGLVSFAGYRLCATDGTPLGVLALFAKHPLSPDEDHLLDGVAASTSHVIQTVRAEAELRQAHNELEHRVRQRTTELATANERLQVEVADRQRTENALRQKEGELAALLDNLPDIAWLKDAESRYILVNKAFAEQCGHTVEELKGKTDLDIWPRNHAEHYRADDLRVLQGSKTLRVNEALTDKEGIDHWLETIKSPIRDAEGRIVGTMGIARDITERRQAERELQEYAERMEATNAALQQARAEAEASRVKAERAKQKLEAVQQRLLDASREAGMAEVATGVLHNAGNVLNSANVSANLVADKVRRSKISGLSKAAALLNEHAHDLGAFLTGDAKGKQLPGYLTTLAEHLAEEQTGLLDELQSLAKNITHIKDIVSMQQNFAGKSGVVQSFAIEELVEDALRMGRASLERHDIQVIREYGRVPEIMADRQKLLQILINLVRNAKHALRDSVTPDKRLTVRTAGSEAERVRLEVIDNGMGIPAENMSRIFTYGFTTKRNGHGFGLHNSALAAKEMGGTLTARSDGPARGAVFTLELPIQPAEVTR